MKRLNYPKLFLSYNELWRVTGYLMPDFIFCIFPPFKSSEVGKVFPFLHRKAGNLKSCC